MSNDRLYVHVQVVLSQYIFISLRRFLEKEPLGFVSVLTFRKVYAVFFEVVSSSCAFFAKEGIRGEGTLRGKCHICTS